MIDVLFPYVISLFMAFLAYVLFDREPLFFGITLMMCSLVFVSVGLAVPQFTFVGLMLIALRCYQFLRGG